MYAIINEQFEVICTHQRALTSTAVEIQDHHGLVEVGAKYRPETDTFIPRYIVEYNTIDDLRRAAYSKRVEPLLSEAKIKALQGHVTEAAELEAQALAVREKIQQELPWPEKT